MPQYNDTKYGSLEETLNAIGKAAFVRFYYDFKDATIPTDILAEKILRESEDRILIIMLRIIFTEHFLCANVLNPYKGLNEIGPFHRWGSRFTGRCRSPNL